MMDINDYIEWIEKLINTSDDKVIQVLKEGLDEIKGYRRLKTRSGYLKLRRSEILTHIAIRGLINENIELKKRIERLEKGNKGIK